MWPRRSESELDGMGSGSWYCCLPIGNLWNGLPDFVSFTSIAAFKRSIRTVDFSQFLMCNNV